MVKMWSRQGRQTLVGKEKVCSRERERHIGRCGESMVEEMRKYGRWNDRQTFHLICRFHYQSMDLFKQACLAEFHQPGTSEKTWKNKFGQGK